MTKSISFLKRFKQRIKHKNSNNYTVLQKFRQFGLFIMFRRGGMKEGGKSLPLAFQYLILMI